MSATIVKTARGPIEVARTGRGPAILFAHGMPGGWYQAMPLAEELADSHESVLVTRPGYGRTPLSSGRTADEQADLYAAVLDELGIDDVTVVGISGGGPSSVAFAQRHPDRTRRLVLLCALTSHLIPIPAYARAGVRVPGAFRVGAAFELRRDRRFVADPPALLEWHRKGMTPSELARLDADASIGAGIHRFYADRAAAPSWHAGMRNDVRQLLRARTPAPTDRIAAPVVVVHGDADTVVSPAHAEHHATAIAGADLHIIEGAGHGLPLVHRDTVTTLLRETS